MISVDVFHLTAACRLGLIPKVTCSLSPLPSAGISCRRVLLFCILTCAFWQETFTRWGSMSWAASVRCVLSNSLPGLLGRLPRLQQPLSCRSPADAEVGFHWDTLGSSVKTSVSLRMLFSLRPLPNCRIVHPDNEISKTTEGKRHHQFYHRRMSLLISSGLGFLVSLIFPLNRIDCFCHLYVYSEHFYGNSFLSHGGFTNIMWFRHPGSQPRIRLS